MKQLPLPILASFVLVACGTAPTPPALASAAPQAQPSPASNQTTSESAGTPAGTVQGAPSRDDRSGVNSVTGTWTYKVANSDYTYPFNGRIEWTTRQSDGSSTTITGRRFVCNGTAVCTENGTVTLRHDGKVLRVSMTESSENCPPVPTESCEKITGIWLEGSDANGKVSQANGKFLISGKANVYTRKPQIDVPFEFRSSN